MSTDPSGTDPPLRDLAVVTGAARGLGAAVSRRLAQRGLTVIAVDHCAGDVAGVPYAQAGRQDLDRLEAQLGAAVRTVVLDVRDTATFGETLRDLIGADERLTTVVAAAATIEGGAAQWETDPAQLERLWQSNVTTVWSTATVTVPHLLAAAESGAQCSFVAIASLAAHEGLFHLAAYCTVKHAVVGLIRGLAADLTGRGVSVSAISPDAMATAMLEATAQLYGLADVAALCQDMPNQVPLDPDDVAAMVEFACVNGPAVHGTAVRATGGLGVTDPLETTRAMG